MYKIAYGCIYMPGNKIKSVCWVINGGRKICQCDTEQMAKRIAKAMNDDKHLRDMKKFRANLEKNNGNA